MNINCILSRREFIKRSALTITGLGFGSLISQVLFQDRLEAATPNAPGVREARYYRPLGETTVQCQLCPRRCTLSNGQRSFCRVREPKDGKLYTLVYGLPCAVHVDPIEKKPIFHMLPASTSFSIATAGCNLRCKFCQNWQISQAAVEETENIELRPERVVELALENNCKSIAYTYSEPTIFYEYMTDTARLATSRNLKNVWVTAGFINPEPLKELAQCIQAANIDLKGFSQKYLEEVCQQDLAPLLEAIKLSKKLGIWIEITNLIVPTLNDDMGMIAEMCGWIKQELGEGVPLHFSRFWPMHKLKNLPPTPRDTLEKAREVALNTGLDYVYIGNVPGHEGNNTYCPKCKKVVLKRAGYTVLSNDILNSKCRFCGYQIPGLWS